MSATHVADTPSISRGQCLCGAVRYEVHGALRPVIYCHCDMCRRASGHFGAFTSCAREQLKIEPSEALRWYQSSPSARRGFCGICGSSLFWEGAGARSVSLAAGSLDKPTRLLTSEHIFTGNAGDYYGILDGLPQHSAWPDQR